MQRCRLTVGDDSCDIRGFTQGHLQCAVDRLALLGGGIVEISAGVFAMADSLHLRSGVEVRGQGARTILRKNAMKSARVNAFLGYGHYDIGVDAPDQFQLGDGILIRDRHAVGFYTTVGTLVGREGATWYTNRPHSHDYMASSDGVVETLFPVVSAYDISDARLEEVTVDGNAAGNPVPLNGCRGGGVFLMRSHRIQVRGVQVRDFNGEGFSFQTCDDVELAGCTAEGCSGNGFHPGSGSNRFHIHGCRARHNGQCGLFYCLRVRDSLLEDCRFESNGVHGVSVGARDTGHMNRRLVIRGNGGAGIYVRADARNDAAHNNAFVDCRLEGNCCRGPDADGEAEIVLQGETEGLRITGNVIRRRPGVPGILVKAGVGHVWMRKNRILPAGPEGCRRESRTPAARR